MRMDLEGPGLGMAPLPRREEATRILRGRGAADPRTDHAALGETGHAMSGASVTNFLHGVVDEGSPVYQEETGKGGRRPVRSPAPHAAEEAYKEWLRRLDAALNKLEARG